MNVQEFIASSNIPKHLVGCEYIKEAIQMKVEDPTVVAEGIYIKLSEKHGKTVYGVSSAIRRAISESYELMDSDLKKKIFNDTEKVPSNGKYISSVAYSIRNGIL